MPGMAAPITKKSYAPCPTMRSISSGLSGIAPDEGDDHDTATESVCRCACTNEIVARLEHRHPKERPGGQPDGACEDPGVANQWLRSLSAHAYRRCAKAWRDRGAPLPARCLARIAALQRARTRRAGVDRGVDA